MVRGVLHFTAGSSKRGHIEIRAAVMSHIQLTNNTVDI